MGACSPFPDGTQWPGSNDQLGLACLRHAPIHRKPGLGAGQESIVKTEVTCPTKGNKPGDDSSDLVPTVSCKLKARFPSCSASAAPGLSGDLGTLNPDTRVQTVSSEVVVCTPWFAGPTDSNTGLATCSVHSEITGRMSELRRELRTKTRQPSQGKAHQANGARRLLR